ncbi:hypothetical protein, partial [Treponema paraluiscuniculi]|uniref:hypothetical protein n=1 Tax=Treponema paraluiscuniculi TaxID=53435 RepID=UPI002FDBC6FE
FLVFLQLCMDFITPKRNPVLVSSHLPFPPSTYFEVAGGKLSISMDFSVLNFSYKWTGTMQDILFLASFT